MVPLLDQPDLPWDYFLLQAALGARQVPEWVLLAVTPAIGLHHGIHPDLVAGEHIDAALDRLPTDPEWLLRRLFEAVGDDVPDPDATPKLDPAVRLGAFRDGVDQGDLLHDATLLVLTAYDRDGFYALVERVDTPEWDARAAVAAMLFLVLVRAA